MKRASPHAVVVFARSPRNETKRLGRGVGPAVHTALLLHTLGAVAQTARTTALVLAVDGEMPDAVARALHVERARGRSVHVVPQRGEGFEARFLGALDAASAFGYERLVAIGSDTPGLVVGDLDEALDADTIVVGPSLDGGFYLVGLDARQRDVLRGLPWLTSRLTATLLARSADHRLLRRLRDIDSAHDLQLSWQALQDLTASLVGVDLRVAAQLAVGASTTLTPLLHVTTPTLRGPPCVLQLV